MCQRGPRGGGTGRGMHACRLNAPALLQRVSVLLKKGGGRSKEARSA